MTTVLSLLVRRRSFFSPFFSPTPLLMLLTVLPRLICLMLLVSGLSVPVCCLGNPWPSIDMWSSLSLVASDDRRRRPSSASFLCNVSDGRRIARSRAYGRPRCRPRIIIAMMISLLSVANSAENDGSMPGYPSESPTVPYADTISNRTAKSVKDCNLSLVPAK